MTLALASGWLDDRGESRGARPLLPAAEAAHAMGFSAVYASAPPSDGARARPVLARLGVSVGGGGARPPGGGRAGARPPAPPPPGGPLALASAIDRAAEGASSVKARAVAVEAGSLPPGATDAEREAAAEALVRALHAALLRWPGLALGMRNGAAPSPCLAFRETEWVLDALRGKPFGLWFDPTRALLCERAERGPTPAAWAERYGSRTVGIFLHGLGRGPGGGSGHARPEDDGPDWGTLRGQVPSRATRVLDVGPRVPRDEVVDARRHFEEVLGW